MDSPPGLRLFCGFQDHVASLIAGLAAMMLAHSAREKSTVKQFIIMTVVGFGLASALGLSMYVTFVFVIFWDFLAYCDLNQKTDRSLILPMVFSGVVAILLASPFIIGLFQSGAGGAGQFPITFEVRSFLQLEFFVKDWPLIARSLVMLVVLPINYLFVGIFFHGRFILV